MAGFYYLEMTLKVQNTIRKEIKVISPEYLTSCFRIQKIRILEKP
jgi:hypothetical protein